MSYFKGKWVLITGASSGIGQSLALVLADRGARLILTARRSAELEATAVVCRGKGSEVLTFLMDVTDENQRHSLQDLLREKEIRLHGLINNAGISQRDYGFDTAPEVDRKIMELNFFAPVFLTKELQPFLQDEARIIVISSMTGLLGFPLRTAYAASKHAINGYFESWQLEKTPYHFTIACPGRIKSNISVHALHGDGREHLKMDEGQAKGMDTEVCAEKIIHAAERKKKLLLVGRQELLLYYIRKFLPFLFYRIASNISPT